MSSTTPPPSTDSVAASLSKFDAALGDYHSAVMADNIQRMVLARAALLALFRALPAPGAQADAEDAAKYRALATPEIHDFLVAVEREALHQRDRWGAEHDAGKADSDWFWLIGYLAGKALHKPEKMLHHIITTAAACLNWHAARLGTHTAMRPGIADPNAARAQEAPR